MTHTDDNGPETERQLRAIKMETNAPRTMIAMTGEDGQKQVISKKDLQSKLRSGNLLHRIRAVYEAALRKLEE